MKEGNLCTQGIEIPNIKEKLPVRYNDCNRNSEEWSSLWTPNIVSTHLKRKVSEVLVHSITPIQKLRELRLQGWFGWESVKIISMVFTVDAFLYLS